MDELCKGRKVKKIEARDRRKGKNEKEVDGLRKGRQGRQKHE